MKKFLFIALLCLAVKVSAGLGAETKAENFFHEFAQNDSAVAGIISSQLGVDLENTKKPQIFTLLNDSPILATAQSEVSPAFFAGLGNDKQNGNTLSADSPSPESGGTLASPKDVIETEIKPDSSYLNSNGIYVKNKTGYSLDLPALLNEPLNLSIDLKKPQILIVHTHGSEAYTPDGDDIYTESDPSRTEDTNYNVVRIGDELEKSLNKRGISVIHDRTLYDYPSYTGSYDRALEAINGHIEKNPDIKIVIDLHRDAFEDDSGNIYKTTADIDGVKSAQVMMVVGSDFSGLTHPDWKQNLKLALKLQSAANEKYPSLMRPISLSQYRYNQHATKGSLILEVGCNGNTLKEALNAINFFADSAADVFLSLSAENTP